MSGVIIERTCQDKNLGTVTDLPFCTCKRRVMSVYKLISSVMQLSMAQFNRDD